MFNWYRQSARCYAYLSDVHLTAYDREILERSRNFATVYKRHPGFQCHYIASHDTVWLNGDHPSIPEIFKELLRDSRWFTRGWTLQELIAPRVLQFYSRDWQLIASRKSLGEVIPTITGIPSDVLEHRPFREYSVAQRMSWAPKRRTTRVEDTAYCLLGLFDVNMPLLYGEGEKAFIRLQEEIIRTSDDQSIFAWRDVNGTRFSHRGLLARSPVEFHDSHQVARNFGVERRGEEPYLMTNKGLRISLPLVAQTENDGTEFFALLACQPIYLDTRWSHVGIHLKCLNAEHPYENAARANPDAQHPLSHGGLLFQRVNTDTFSNSAIVLDDVHGHVQQIYVRQSTTQDQQTTGSRIRGIRVTLSISPEDPIEVIHFLHSWPVYDASTADPSTYLLPQDPCPVPVSTRSLFERRSRYLTQVEYNPQSTVILSSEQKVQSIPVGTWWGVGTNGYLRFRVSRVKESYVTDMTTPPQDEDLLIDNKAGRPVRYHISILPQGDHVILDIRFKIYFKPARTL